MPGGPEYPLQIIDVRDLANFTIDCLDQRIADTFNTVTPTDSYSMGQLLDDSQAVTASEVVPVWVDETFAGEAQEKVQGPRWGMFPIWHSLEGDSAKVSSVSGKKAVAAGMHNRPVRETIRDLLTWWKTLPEERTATMRAGMSADVEAELLASWKSRDS